MSQLPPVFVHHGLAAQSSTDQAAKPIGQNDGTPIIDDRTISQDETDGVSAREKRMLAALGRDQAPAKGKENSNHALQDFQMQLMLLEQQNKKRLLMARQEQQTHGPAMTDYMQAMQRQDIQQQQVQQQRAQQQRAQQAMAVPPPLPLPHPQSTGNSYYGQMNNNTSHPPSPVPYPTIPQCTIPYSGYPQPLPPVNVPTQPLPAQILGNFSGDSGDQYDFDDFLDSEEDRPLGHTTSAFDSMVDEMDDMHFDNGSIQNTYSSKDPVNPRDISSDTMWPVLHRIECPLGGQSSATYMDAPTWVLVEECYHLDGRRRIVDERQWERNQKKAPFVVYLTYSCTSHGQKSDDSENEKAGRSHGGPISPLQQHLIDCCKHPKAPLHSPKPVKEEIRLLSNRLRKGLQAGFNELPRLALYRPDMFEQLWTLESPYLINYHCRYELETGRDTFAAACKDDFVLMLKYLQHQTAKHEAAADRLFGAGEVTLELLRYLFNPEELLINTKDAEDVVAKSTSCIVHSSGPSWCLSCEYIEFNGEFIPREKTGIIEFPDTKAKTVKIEDLKIFPLKFATPEKIAKLRKRGEFFYSCSKVKYVTGPEKQRSDSSSARYMVDVKTYRLMHEVVLNRARPKTLERSHDDNFILRLPGKIKGFHMQDKKWVELSVDQLSTVNWNMTAFESLAVDDNTKELIQAVVTNKIEADNGTDLVSGKGNGLIVLLHGGPGTGKTLTAESVAEIAQKPLYRVSCGDVGTDPRRVEEYLEQVFTLGRRWGCVVLLDEADVFLEQRSFANLERNALVSVFLRVLEYYDGILILTSNRVGTFDEAFKSRIQLAIHYEPLSGAQRYQIWGNFIKRLEDLEENMDIENVKYYLGKLAAYPLNGRQIRNVVTTARQLARYRKEKMSFVHLERAISVSTKFERYLLAVQDNEPDDERARAEGIR